jgi:tyrosyl-tRNA synthetase
VQKMSKSLNNAIGVNDPASEMYGKLMSINDELMWKYWTFLTDLPQSQIDAMQGAVAGGAVHPMQAKKELARLITTGFHSLAEADAAAESWATQFQQKGIAEDLPEVTISKTDKDLVASESSDLAPMIRVPKLLVLAGLAASTGEAARKIAENAVSINGSKCMDRIVSLDHLGEAPTLRLGKKAIRIHWTD